MNMKNNIKLRDILHLLNNIIFVLFTFSSFRYVDDFAVFICFQSAEWKLQFFWGKVMETFLPFLLDPHSLLFQWSGAKVMQLWSIWSSFIVFWTVMEYHTILGINRPPDIFSRKNEVCNTFQVTLNKQREFFRAVLIVVLSVFLQEVIWLVCLLLSFVLLLFLLDYLEMFGTSFWA